MYRSFKDENILSNLDALRHLITRMRFEGKYTHAQPKEDYYNEIRERPRIKDLIKGTEHENPIPKII